MSLLHRRRHAAAAAFLAIVMLAASGQGTMRASDNKGPDGPGLTGTWQMIFRYPGFPDDYFAVLAFHEGGTMTALAVDGPRTSVSLGAWKKLRGPGNFAASYDGLFDGDADGSFDRRFRDRLTIRLSSRDTLVATAASDALSLDGSTPLGPPLPGITIEGTRMEVMRE